MKTTITTILSVFVLGCGSDFTTSDIQLDKSSDGGFSDVINTDSKNIADSFQDKTDTAVDSNNDTFIQCNVSNCPSTEHGTAFCNQNNKCDIQCVSGCIKNGTKCECPQPECCMNPNFPMELPAVCNEKSLSCINGICQNNGFVADTDKCIAFCVICLNKEFDHIYYDQIGSDLFKYCECK